MIEQLNDYQLEPNEDKEYCSYCEREVDGDGMYIADQVLCEKCQLDIHCIKEALIKSDDREMFISEVIEILENIDDNYTKNK